MYFILFCIVFNTYLCNLLCTNTTKHHVIYNVTWLWHKFGLKLNLRAHSDTVIVWNLSYIGHMLMALGMCYDFSYFVLFTYVFSLFLEVSHGATALTHFSLTHSTAVVLTHSIAILIHQEINKNLMLPYESYIRTVRLCKV